MKPTSCPECGVLLPPVDGPVHPYMLSSPACWGLYGEVLAREYSDMPGFGARHRLTVDAYAAQHPGKETPAAIKSVGVHLVRLYLMLEGGLKLEEANAAMQKLTQVKHRFHWLTPPANHGGVTVGDVHAATSAAEHVKVVQAWAASVWSAWKAHHAQVHEWARLVG
jgi:hypothetical protein